MDKKNLVHSGHIELCFTSQCSTFEANEFFELWAMKMPL